jgi:hypothetical protein
MVKEITDTITEIKTKTDPIHDANVKITDKPLLEETLVTVADLLENKTGNLTEEEIALLEDKKTAIEEELVVIRTTEETIADIQAKTVLILPENVKSSDKALLDSILAAVDDLLNNKAGNLVDEEKTALIERKTDIEKELVKVKAVADAIADINAKILGITLGNVKSSDKADLDAALKSLNDLLVNQYGNLIVTEKSTLEKHKVETENTLAKIWQVADAMKAAENTASGITLQNVTKQDETGLEDAGNAYRKILADYAGNLTASEKKQTEEKMNVVLSAMASLDAVEAVEAQINALSDTEEVTKEQAAAIEKASKAFSMLSDYQKSLLDPAVAAKLETTVTALKSLLLQDNETGTRVEGVDGTIFNINTELFVTQITAELDDKTMSLYNFGIQSVSNGQEIVQLYDIKLMLDGVAIQPDGKVKITIKLTEAMKLFGDLKVVYIADDGTVTILPFESNDTEIWFVTDHFSNYGIIGTPQDSFRAVDGVLTGLIALIAIAIPTFGILLFIKRRKRKEMKGLDETIL